MTQLSRFASVLVFWHLSVVPAAAQAPASTTERSAAFVKMLESRFLAMQAAERKGDADLWRSHRTAGRVQQMEEHARAAGRALGESLREIAATQRPVDLSQWRFLRCDSTASSALLAFSRDRTLLPGSNHDAIEFLIIPFALESGVWRVGDWNSIELVREDASLERAIGLVVQPTRIGDCKYDHCLTSLIPHDTENPPALEECASLDGRMEPGSGGKDLGILCRRAASRALAGKRSREPCRNAPDGGPGDDAFGLDQPLVLKTLRDSLLEPLVAKHSLEYPTSNVNFEGTMDGSYGTQVQDQDMSFTMYLCINDEPVPHYTPYFWVSERKGARAESAFVAAPPPLAPALYQAARVADEPGQVLGFGDLDGDGADDVAFARQRGFEFFVAACLYQKGESNCRLVIGNEPVASKDHFLDPELSIAPEQVTLRLSKDGKPGTTAIYRIEKSELVLERE